MLKRLSFVNPVIVIAILSVAVLAGGVVFISRQSEPQTPEEQNLLGEYIPEQGREHIDPGQGHAPYSSNPPTSGPHYLGPAEVSIYDNELADEQLIHNLEHGHVWITYKTSSASAELIEKLKGTVQENSRLVVLTPREANDSLIALASWTRLLKLDQFDKEKIVDFIKTNRGNAPEFVP